jgi:hypothetical protein
LVDVGALGDGYDREAAIGELKGGAGIGKNPGTKDDMGIEFLKGFLEGGAEGGRHEQVIGRAADFWKVNGGYPAGLERFIFPAWGEVIACPGECGTRGEDADIEMGTEGVEKRGVIQAAVGLGGGGEEIREEEEARGHRTLGVRRER